MAKKENIGKIIVVKKRRKKPEKYFEGSFVEYLENPQINVMAKKENNDYLLFKWGTLKGFCFENSPEAWEAMKEYNEIGSSFSAMMQKDTPRQKELLCIMIDKVKGSVTSDWTGEDWTKDREAAKKYVMDYRKK